MDYIRPISTARLITTDIKPIDISPFLSLHPQIQDRVSFVQTDAVELQGITPNSIDVLVSDYSLCAINSDIGKLGLALDRFHTVLKPGAWLLIEEEFPLLSSSDLPQAQQFSLWREQWQLLKALLILTETPRFHEISPVFLQKLLTVHHFHHISIETGITMLDASEVSSHFLPRVQAHAQNLTLPTLKRAFLRAARTFTRKLKGEGMMQIPYYTIKCQNTG